MITALILKSLRQSIQVMIVLLLGVTLGAFAMTHVKSAFAANLKSLSVIDRNVIHAGDLFDGLSTHKDKVIGAAPKPGHDMIIDSRTLLRIALALDLPWRPSAGQEQIVIRRAASVIAESDLGIIVKDALSGQGAPERFNINYIQAPKAFILPQSETSTAEVSRVSYDSSKDYFEAEIVSPSKDRPLQRQIVSGKLEHLVSVPVLTETLQHGSVIGSGDINWIEMPSYQVQHDVVLDGEKLIGMTPRRMAVAGKPIRSNEVSAPLLVERGDVVTILYHTGPVQLTTEGKAMQNGSNGEIIRVVNTDSSRSIEARITGDRTVTVQ